jgi:glycosyltransferase involved in cell wall biosynthesis
VASCTGGIPEVVKNKENGLLVSSADSYGEILEALQYLIVNKEQRLLMGQRGLAMVKKEFNLDNTVGKTEDLYYQILSNSPKSNLV